VDILLRCHSQNFTQGLQVLGDYSQKNQAQGLAFFMKVRDTGILILTESVQVV
jgi:hypothetical protein